MPYFHRQPDPLDDEKFSDSLSARRDFTPTHSPASSYDFGSEIDCPLLVDKSAPRSPVPQLSVNSGLSRIRLRPRLFALLCFAIMSITALVWRVATPSLLDLIPGTRDSSLRDEPFELTTGSRFRDSLDPNGKYITSFLTAGWTNDVMSVIHTLQLGLYSGRTPVLPPFQPSHAPHWSGFIKFSDVFSIPRLSDALNMTILEWADIKDTHSDPPRQHYEEYYGGEKEELGCWSLWMTQWAGGVQARGGTIPSGLNLDISYTPVPFGYKNRDSLNVNIHYLSSLGLPFAREEAIRETKATYLPKLQETINKIPEANRVKNPPTEVPVPNGLGSKIDPDEQMLCFDFLFYTSPFTENQRNPDFDPEWQVVGKHMHFSDSLTALSTEFLLTTLALPEGTPLPPLITVHVRRQDWAKNCRQLHVPLDECLAPLSAYARRVDEVRTEMLEAHPEWTTDDIKVVVLSDEPRKDTRKSLDLGFTPGSSEAWWTEVQSHGWFSIDHDTLETIKVYGEWYPIIVDACILSMGHGFVGTERSTYSSISGQRVEEWQNGPIRTVRWGKKGADDH